MILRFCEAIMNRSHLTKYFSYILIIYKLYKYLILCETLHIEKGAGWMRVIIYKSNKKV